MPMDSGTWFPSQSGLACRQRLACQLLRGYWKSVCSSESTKTGFGSNRVCSRMRNPGFQNRVDSHVFVAEVYRRMSLRHRAERRAPTWAEVKDNSQVLLAADQLRGLLPSGKQSAILDVGFGEGLRFTRLVTNLLRQSPSP